MTLYRVHFNHAGPSIDVDATDRQIVEGAVVFTNEEEGGREFIVSLESLSYVEEITVD